MREGAGPQLTQAARRLFVEPVPEHADLARVVAEAAPGEYAVQRRQVALEARGPLADDLRAAERELGRWAERVVPVDAEEQAVELVELVAPVGGRPLADVARV